MGTIKVDNGSILIFTTVTNSQRLSQASILIMDGTFSIAPNNFKQIFTIHGCYEQGERKPFLPFVHMLLPNKNEATYKIALRHLKHLAKENRITLAPKYVLTDFETAEINAIKHVFPSKYGYWYAHMRDILILSFVPQMQSNMAAIFTL